MDQEVLKAILHDLKGMPKAQGAFKVESDYLGVTVDTSVTTAGV